ncbi:Divergent PAP2 family/PAP2 superfamily [Novymonas esmeraldas]|uniref:Divergent PAP2 family/PAP2 superfamily n=1 Tax=Novymonas esmeraldas TaxID=1808958 RepID=A0AAW0ESC2_9TRYP
MRLLSRINYYVDKSCSLGVVGAVAFVNVYTLQYFPSTVVVPFLTSCSCVAAAISKALKRVVNQSRPRGAPKLSPGMPSNHATSLSFLCVATVYGLQRYAASIVDGTAADAAAVRRMLTDSAPLPSLPVEFVRPLQVLVAVYSVYATSLRVVQGHHTVAQVTVGYALGILFATLTLLGNYGGYTGARAGGRVDDLPSLAKVAVMAASVTVSLVAMRAIVRGALPQRARRAVARSA